MQTTRAKTILTPVQFRMAKAALGVSNRIIADELGLHKNTLQSIEVGKSSTSTMRRVRDYFQQRGVSFAAGEDGETVRLAHQTGASGSSLSSKK